MKKICRVLGVIVLLILAGCATDTQRAADDQSAKAALQTKVHAVKQQQIESVRTYIRAAADSLALLPPTLQTDNTKLSLNLDNQALRVIGNPAAADELNVSKLLAQNQDELKKLGALEQENTKNIQQLKIYSDQMQKIQTDLDKANQQVTLEAQQLEAEQHKSLITHIWEWSIGSFGLIGGIAFIVLCPAIALPMLGALFNWFITSLPTFVSFFSSILTGIVGYITAIISNIYKSTNTTIVKTSVTTLSAASTTNVVSTSALSGA